jgi:hypothetical protein
MGAYHLRKDDSEYRVNDELTVIRLARVGLIRPEDRLCREGEKRFRAASSFKELKKALETDTWEAWEALGDADPDTLWKASVEWVGGAKPEALRENIAPDSEPKTKEAVEPTPPEEERIAPVEAPAIEALAEEVEDSNVIVFPTPTAAPIRRSQTSAQPEPSRATVPSPLPEFMVDTVLRRATPPRQFRAFPWVFGGILVLGSLVLMAVHFYVENTAKWTSSGPKGPPPNLVRAEAEAFAPEIVVAAPESNGDEPAMERLFREKTEELRARLSRGVVPMTGKPDDLTNALMIEMSRMRVGLIKLRAPVHAWGGRQNDLPSAAEVHIILKSQDDLIEQLGATVLVVGKYLQAYELTLTDFVVGLQDPTGIVQERRLSPEGAQAVFMNRKSMREFLME